MAKAALCCCLASRVSAISLSNFQLITSSSIPLGCILAYNQPLSDCAVADFTQGNSCSAACQTGIQATEQTLQTACENVNASPDSVLEAAILGGLLSLLCGIDNEETTTTTITTTNRPTSTAAVALTSPLSPSFSDTTSSTSTTSFSTEQPTPEPPPTQVAPAPAQSSPTPPPIDTDRQTTLSQPDSTPGGGSPFDAVVSGSALGPVIGGTQLLLLAVLAVFFVAR